MNILAGEASKAMNAFMRESVSKTNNGLNMTGILC